MAKKTSLTSLHRIFATDMGLEEAGAWVMVNDYIGLRIKVRRARADVVQKAYQRILREELGDAKVRKPEDITTDQAERVAIRQIAETILVDWEGVTDADTGEVVPYSVEKAIEFLGVRDFREFVMQQAGDRDTFKARADAESEGN